MRIGIIRKLFQRKPESRKCTYSTPSGFRVKHGMTGTLRLSERGVFVIARAKPVAISEIASPFSGRARNDTRNDIVEYENESKNS